MRACARLTVSGAPGGGYRITEMTSAAPVGWRPTPAAVYMVGTAASPAGDDDVRVEVAVGTGASLSVRSTAATVAWRGRGTRHTTTVRVASGARLHWAPQPVIATAGCAHRQDAEVALERGASLVWEEQLVLGRHGEGPGALAASLSVEVAGRPLLRHGLRVGTAGTGWDGPAVLGAARACGLVLVAGAPPGVAAAPACGEGWSVMALDGPGFLGLAVSPDALGLASAMVAMRSALGVGQAGAARGG